MFQAANLVTPVQSFHASMNLAQFSNISHLLRGHRNTGVIAKPSERGKRGVDARRVKANDKIQILCLTTVSMSHYG
jgi:hypothetical protein